MRLCLVEVRCATRRDRDEELTASGQSRESARRDADDRVRPPIEVDDLADDLRIRVVPALPERVRENGFAGRARMVIDGAVEVASCARDETQRPEVGGRNSL